MGEPLPSACLSNPSWAAARGTFNGHFRVLKNVPSASKCKVGSEGGAHTAQHAQHQSQVLAPCQGHLTWGEGGGHTPEQSQQEGTLALQAQSRPQFKGKRQRGGVQPGHSGSTHDYTLSSSRRGYEGFGNYYSHLLCRAEADPVSLCFRAESRRSQEKPVSAEEAAQ